MSPPPDASIDLQNPSLSGDDLQRIKWAGWTLVAVFGVAWIGWVSLLAIANSEAVVRTETTQAMHYEVLREDIREIKNLLESRP